MPISATKFKIHIIGIVPKVSWDKSILADEKSEQ